MYNQADTIKSYEEIRRVVRGDPILTLTRKSILILVLLLGILGGLFLADCWGNIPATQKQLPLQIQNSNGNMQQFLQRELIPLNQVEPSRLKTMTNNGKSVAARLKHQRRNAELRKRIQARKNFFKEKRKCKIARIIFLVSISKPVQKP